ncbi:DUF6056 family protein, partial [Paucilactobacillus suebicus]
MVRKKDRVILVLKNKLIFIIMSFVFIFMTIWNYFTPLWNDDESMTGMSFVKIIKSGVNDYFNYNGRFLGQTIFRILVNIPLPLEAILNSFVFVLLTYLIFLNCQVKCN